MGLFLNQQDFLLVFLLFGLAQANVIRQSADKLQYYEEELLADVYTGPYMLSVDYESKKLFFKYADVLNNGSNQAAYLDLETKEYYKINGVERGSSNVVDNKNHVVYIGGSDGIYKFDYETNTAIHLGNVSHYNIYHLFYQDGLYYTTYNERKAYAWNNGTPVLVDRLKDVELSMFVADSKNNLYVVNGGIFKYEASNEDSEPILLCDVFPYALIKDENDNIFFSDSFYIYTIRDNQCKKIIRLDDIHGLAVDKDGSFIYSNKYNIYRLKLDTKCVC